MDEQEIGSMSMDGMQFQIADEVLARPVGESLVLFHPTTERLLTLNASGARIWELLSEGVDAGQLVDRLADEFEGHESVIRQEVMEFLSQLESEQVIRPAA
jgi:hypothetical protein